MDSSSSSSDGDVQMEDMEVMNFLLRSKLASHEITYQELTQNLNHERNEKMILQQTMNDLISIATDKALESSILAAESDSTEEISNLQLELDEKSQVISNLEKKLIELKNEVQEKDLDQEKFDEMEVKNFILQSKLSSHEVTYQEQKQALCQEKNEKMVLQKTMDDLVTFTFDYSTEKEKSFIVAESESTKEILNLQQELEQKSSVISNLKTQLAHLKEKVQEQDLDKEKIDEMTVQIFLLESKLSSHEITYQEQKQALLQEKKEKKDILETMNDLVTIAAESDLSQEVETLQRKFEESNTVITNLENQLTHLKQKISDHDLEKENFDIMSVQVFLLQSKLSSHEAFFDELKIKTDLEQEKIKDEAFSMIEQERSLNNQKNEQKNHQISSLQCSLDTSISKAKSLQLEVLQLQKTLSALQIKHSDTLKLNQERIDNYDVEVFLLNR